MLSFPWFLHNKISTIQCLFADYRNEPLRLTELDEMTKKLSDLFSSDSHQIWTGDFNALTREDYDESTWEEIATVRRNNSWESPKTELTEKVQLST